MSLIILRITLATTFGCDKLFFFFSYMSSCSGDEFRFVWKFLFEYTYFFIYMQSGSMNSFILVCQNIIEFRAFVMF